jgi:microcystin-dependent protein
MVDPFVAEIRMFAGNFAPAGWALCNGQILPISQNTALFSLLGTIYGGDGKSTFALPDLQATSPLHPGQGPGLSRRDLGERGGSANVTLISNEMPIHTHTGMAAGSGSGQADPTGAVFASGQRGRPPAYGLGTTRVPMSPFSIGIAGSSLPHNNLPPYLAVTFIIALQGIFPQRWY